MKVSGFTLIRNGTLFDYPYLESIRSLVPLVDELVINVGIGEDDTLTRVQALAHELGSSKFKIFESKWPLDDPEKKREGKILSEQTNLALDRCAGDWCIYLQGDEVLHEDDARQLRRALETADRDDSIEGLLFDYVHFYGSYGVVQSTRTAYRFEVRAIRRSSGARSVGDAQSFRKPDGDKLAVARSGAKVYHYGWVRSPEAMRAKTYFMDRLYHGDYAPESASAKEALPHTGDNYRYKKFWGLSPFKGSHPSTMQSRISQKGWHWDLKNSPLIWSVSDLKKIALDLFERLSGYRLFEYRPFRLIKDFRDAR